MAVANSSRGTRRSGRLSGGNRPRTHPSRKRRRKSADTASKTRTDLHEVLYHFSQALAIIETVAHALEAAENEAECASVGAEIATLRHGVNALRAVHEEFDLAIPRRAS